MMRGIYIEKIRPILLKLPGLLNVILYRNFGLLYVIFIFATYLIRRLVQEASDHRQLLASDIEYYLPEVGIVGDLPGYNFIVDYYLPVITEVCCFLFAWYFFHFKIHKQIIRNFYDWKVWAYLVLSTCLLIAGIWVYYHLRWDNRIVNDSWTQERAHQLKIMSYSRLSLILTDTVAFGVFLLLFESIARYYRNLVDKVSQESSWRLKLTVWFQIGIILAFFLFLAFNQSVEDAQPLAINGEDTMGEHGAQLISFKREFIFALGLVIFIFFLQNYFYQLDQKPQRGWQIFHLMVRLSFAVLMGFTITAAFFLNQTYYLPTVYKTIDSYSLADFLNISFRYSLIVTFVCSILATSIAYVRRVQTRLLSKTNELATLRAQIHPHFLYNVLNNLHSTALEEDSRKTADGILQLSGLMRFMLRESNQERVAIRKEIEYLHHYIQLQRNRLDPTRDIRIDVSLQEPDREIDLAPMLFQPFIENAFKHGISFSSPSWIFITLTINANDLYFKVYNSVHPRNDSTLDGSGVGLENVRKRLEILYPNRHLLVVRRSEKDFLVSVTLKL